MVISNKNVKIVNYFHNKEIPIFDKDILPREILTVLLILVSINSFVPIYDIIIFMTGKHKVFAQFCIEVLSDLVRFLKFS